MEREILHVDMNNFYASVECLYHPELRGKPVAVGGDPERRHGIVLAKNYEAKRFGVKTGEALWQAREKCPDILFVEPHFDRYLKYSQMAHEIYDGFTDQVESFGLDECWLDVTGSRSLFGGGEQVAKIIRGRIKSELGVTASVGVSFNKIFAKLGSDMKKPDATTVIRRKNYRTAVWPLPAEDLLYVGPATKRKLKQMHIQTIGELANTDVSLLELRFGKIGRMLWSFANGLDTSPVAKAGQGPKIKSIGNSTTTPRDLINDHDIRVTLYVLCESVAQRLREQGARCTTVQVSMRDNELFCYEAQAPLETPSYTARTIFACAWALCREKRRSKKPLRSIGVRACNLIWGGTRQLSFLSEIQQEQKYEALENAIDGLRSRFGHTCVQRGLLLEDVQLSRLNPKDDHVIHPIGFLGQK